MIKKTLISCITASFLAGCASQVPMPEAYPYSTQQKMQSAHHWDVLAGDVARRFKGHFQELAVKKPIYIKPEDKRTPFNQAFRELLTTQFINQGINIKKDPENTLILEYNAQVLSHHDRGFIRQKAGYYTLLSSGVLALAGTGELIAKNNPWWGALPLLGFTGAADFLTGTHWGGENTPNTEVIINVSLLEKSKYLLRRSAVYYINVSDHYHYEAQKQLVGKMIKFVNE